MEFLTSEKLYSNFYRLYGKLKKKSDKIDIPISPGQLRFLAGVKSEAPITQKKLQEQFCIKASSLSTGMAKLEEEGFLIRKRDEKDKRNMIIDITQKGIKLVEDNYDTQKKLSKEFFDVLSEEEQKTLQELILKLINQE